MSGTAIGLQSSEAGGSIAVIHNQGLQRGRRNGRVVGCAAGVLNLQSNCTDRWRSDAETLQGVPVNGQCRAGTCIGLEHTVVVQVPAIGESITKEGIDVVAAAGIQSKAVAIVDDVGTGNCHGSVVHLCHCDRERECR